MVVFPPDIEYDLCGGTSIVAMGALREFVLPRLFETRQFLSDLVLEGADERGRELVSRLDGRTPRSALAAEFGGDTVDELLELLSGEGLVEDASAYDALTDGERGHVQPQQLVQEPQVREHEEARDIGHRRHGGRPDARSCGRP